jgi:ssDNA-binding Zn-finger/Zn-ribbon topoisomerase 1
MAVKRNKRCPMCGDFMVFRKGKWGAFYGCHNYPSCKYTEKYEPNK